jgi:hypothetical protein
LTSGQRGIKLRFPPGDSLEGVPAQGKTGIRLCHCREEGIIFSDPFEENQHHMNDLSGISFSSPPLLKAGFQPINQGITFGCPLDGNLQKSKQ